jgi:hypothetical protein
MIEIPVFQHQNFRIKNKIIIEPDMFYSKAYMELSASALRTLQRCLQKRKWSTVKIRKKKSIVYENEGFIFPYSEAELLNIKSTQFWKNIRKLIEAGFIDIVHQGGWYQKNEKHKDYSVYCLSERWRHYGTDQFKKVEKPKVLQKDYCVRENIRRQRTKPTSQKRSGHLHDSEVDGGKMKNIRLHESEVSESFPNTPETLTGTG